MRFCRDIFRGDDSVGSIFCGVQFCRVIKMMVCASVGSNLGYVQFCRVLQNYIPFCRVHEPRMCGLVGSIKVGR